VVMAEAIKRGDGDSGCNHGEGLREGSEGDGVWRCGLCGWRFPHPSTRAIKGLVD
jgi:ribosomal protein L37AE/L43A